MKTNECEPNEPGAKPLELRKIDSTGRVAEAMPSDSPRCVKDVSYNELRIIYRSAMTPAEPTQ